MMYHRSGGVVVFLQFCDYTQDCCSIKKVLDGDVCVHDMSKILYVKCELLLHSSVDALY